MAVTVNNTTGSAAYNNCTTTTGTSINGTSINDLYTTYTIPADTWSSNHLVINSNALDTSSFYTFSINNQSIEDICKKVIDDYMNQNKKQKENKTVKQFGKFNFGAITDGSVALSMYGIAVKNTVGEYVTYDENKDEIISVDGLTFDNSNNMIFSMPVPLKDVELGSLIIHNKHYCYVIDGSETLLQVIDVSDGTVKEIMPTKSPFGFNFVTCVKSLVDLGKANADSPFGDNFLPYMLLMNGGLDKSLLPYLLMQKDSKMDPMMLALLLK